MQIGVDGNKWIYTRRSKTNTAVRVPLLAEAERILKRYKTHPKIDGTEKLLPVYSNQKTNQYLKEIAKATTANPVNRRNELMVRLHGFEVYADKHGYVADFLTITCPSRMHSVHNSGKPNDKYDGTTPKQAQSYLAVQWAKARSKLDKLNIDYFGFRVVEPHHDGTPHWHLLVFMKPEQREEFCNTIKHCTDNGVKVYISFWFCCSQILF